MLDGDAAGNALNIETETATTRLVGLGTAVPTHRVTQEETSAFLIRVAESRPDSPPRYGRYVRYLSKNSGIDGRHTVVADFAKRDPQDFTFFPKSWSLEPTPSTAVRMDIYRHASVALAETAARRAIEDSGLAAESITHLVISTCTGFFAPGPDIVLMERLGLTPSVQRTILGFMGCFAGVNGLRAADHIVRAEPDAVVLQVAVELCSLHYQTAAELELLVPNLLFADGAAAAVYRRSPGRREPAPRVANTASFVSANTQDEMGWRIGDRGFVMNLTDAVPDHLGIEAPGFVDRLIAPAGLSRGDIDGWVIHPGGKKILVAVGEALELETNALDSSFGVLRDYGNMSSATILFVLERLHRNRAPATPGPVVAMSFGPGLTMEGALLVP